MRPERSPITLAEDMADNSGEVVEPRAKKRRVFLQTMGQQLREVGTMQDSPADMTENMAKSTGDTSHIQSLNDTPGTDRPQTRQVQIQTPESDAVPGDDDQLPTGATLSASKNLWLPSEVLTIPVTDGSDIFTFEDLLSWTRSYFDNWHPAYPFLHAPSILDYFESIARHRVLDSIDSSTYQLTILRSIISISLADCRQTGAVMRPVPPQLVFACFNDAIHSIQCVLTDESSILSLQAVISVQLLLVSMLRYNAASRLEGLAVRMAFHLGLHHCPMQLTAVPKQEAQLRQRVFWSVYCIDRFICIRLGVPLGIRDRDIDVCFPNAERHGDAAHEGSDRDDRLDLLGFLARHAEIRGSISELRNKSVSYRRTESDVAEVIGAELTKWWNDVDEYLDSNSSSALPISQYHRVTLVVLRHESIIALNKHTLATSKKSSAYDAALQNCIGAARSIINTLHRVLETWSDPDPSVARPLNANSGLLWPSFTWAVWMSTFLIIYAANEDQVPQDVAIRFADRALDVLKHLTRRGSIWPNACAASIRGLRTQLIDQRNRSRHTHTYNSHGSKDIQGDSATRIHSRSIPPQSNNNSDTHMALNSARAQQPLQFLPAEMPSSRGNYRILHSSHDSGSMRDMSNARDDLGHSFLHDIHSTSILDMPQQFIDQQNWMLSQLMPDFSNAESSGYASDMAAHLGLGLQMPNGEDAVAFNELEMPFWTSNEQRRGMGGN